jgi:anaerobic dimethyl sulfoxide reductase subunit B (iron-sulfur subunit)
MTRYGILIDYQYCCGCHTCEVACQKENGLSVGQWGIKVEQIGPWQIEGSDRYQYAFIPVPTDSCTLCGKRTAKGKLPMCVQHCQTDCMRFGTVDELSAELATKGKQVLFVPR